MVGAVIAVSMVALSAIGVAGAYEGPIQAVAQGVVQAQEGGGPEANLPFLFAVYIITWAAFFAYVFYVSRRQRELRNEIQDLKRALEERDRRTSEQ
jgi:CcmD family protein